MSGPAGGWPDVRDLEHHRQATDWNEGAERVPEEERAERVAHDWEFATYSNEPQPEEDPW